ncbi:MAG: hypothetical protein ABSF53_09015 [Terracidiphilus sp.]|jgi:hypothetical protein
MRKTILTLFLLAFFVPTLGPLLVAQQPLNNDAIIKMAKAGLSDDVIITSINANPGTYDTTTDGLIALKKAKVSDKVVSAIIVKSAGGAPATAPGIAGGLGESGAISGVPAGVDSVGVYYLDPSGGWQEVPAEVVNFKTGGALKHIATVGIIKEDMNGDIAGNRSRLTLKFPASFILYVPEGTSPGEYQLLRLHVNPDNREFRSVTGGVVHESGGANNATVEFSSKKLAPRVYQITLGTETGRGEFGFLPPQDAGAGKSMASSGKIFTFSLVSQ